MVHGSTDGGGTTAVNFSSVLQSRLGGQIGQTTKKTGRERGTETSADDNKHTCSGPLTATFPTPQPLPGSRSLGATSASLDRNSRIEKVRTNGRKKGLSFLAGPVPPSEASAESAYPFVRELPKIRTKRWMDGRQALHGDDDARLEFEWGPVVTKVD